MIVVVFATARDVEAAARKADEAGTPALDALLPNPVEGIERHLRAPRARNPIGWVMVVAGAILAALVYLMQWYSATIDYPVLSGGRPFNSWQVFLIPTYEAAILGAGVVGLLGLIVLCGFPRLNHPLFELAGIGAANRDRYLLLFDPAARAWVEANLAPADLLEGPP